ncbi:MAG: zinc-dependent alcohol dehydrogenase family protein [Calditrichia bacterium]
MKALQIESPNRAGVVELPEPTPHADQVLIRVMACGICGTDIHILRGEYIGNYPVIPGHEFSGIIEQVGDQVKRLRPGLRVAVEPNISCDNCFYCLSNRQNFCENWQAIGVTLPGGMAWYVLAPEKAVFEIGELPFEYGAFMEPLSCVIHGIQRVNLNISDRVLILGAGPIGQLFIQMARLQGAAFIAVLEQRSSRINLAQHFGAQQIVTDLNALPTDDFDVVIDATGNIPLMEKTVDFARPGGKILLFGVPPAGEIMRMEGIQIFRKGLTLMSTFTSVRNSLQAISLLKTGQVDVSALISHQLPLEAFMKGIELIESGRDQVNKVIILPQES